MHFPCNRITKGFAVNPTGYMGLSALATGRRKPNRMSFQELIPMANLP